LLARFKVLTPHASSCCIQHPSPLHHTADPICTADTYPPLRAARLSCCRPFNTASMYRQYATNVWRQVFQAWMPLASCSPCSASPTQPVANGASQATMRTRVLVRAFGITHACCESAASGRSGPWHLTQQHAATTPGPPWCMQPRCAAPLSTARCRPSNFHLRPWPSRCCVCTPAPHEHPVLAIMPLSVWQRLVCAAVVCFQVTGV
jgi:hypothetical protein